MVSRLARNDLLEQKLVYFDVTIIHNQVFGQVVFQSVSIDYFKLAVALEPIDHSVNALLKLTPVLLEGLHLGLCDREVLIKLFEVVVIINLLKFVLGSDFLQLASDFARKLSSLLRQLLLHFEQVPISPYTPQHLVEEVVEVLS